MKPFAVAMLNNHGDSALVSGAECWLVGLGLAALYLPTFYSLALRVWQPDERAHGSIMVNPTHQAALTSVYRQTLARIYQNPTGERIMLSIAYGGDQSANGMQVHRPEFCYAAQGFQLVPGQAGEMVTCFGNLPATRLEARNGQRIEPMTYWIRVGDTAYGSALQKRLLEVEYSLKGTIPDGVIFRVSPIDGDALRAYAVQDDFIAALVIALDASGRQRIAGLQPAAEAS